MINEKKKCICDLINIDGVSKSEIYDLLCTPPTPEMGDFCMPCFKLAKLLRKSPVIIAKELADCIECKGVVSKVEAVNGYLNFFVDKCSTACSVVREICEKGFSYGDSDDGVGKTVCIDYSSINIAKPFHIGHLFTTVLGGSLCKIYDKLGYKTVGINHLGDWGTQFGKLIVAFKKWCSEEELEKRGMDALTEIYVRFHKEAEEQPELEDQAREWFKKIEDGEKEALRLFGIFKDITLKEVEKVYDRLNVKFDSYNGEAFYNDKMQPVLDELESKNILTVSEGAKIVDLSEYNMPPCLIVKKDGATLYATRDLAAAYYRKNTYDFYKCLYVVAYQQNLHFKQVFKVLELLGKDWAKDMHHVAFGMVSLEDGAMSTRKGKVILLRDVLNRAVEKSLDIIKEKSPNLPNKEKVAEQVGTGAVIFSTLYNNRIKDMVFSYDKVLNFEGETGPYVQYTNARCLSVLDKVGDINCAESDFGAIGDAESFAVVSALERFTDVLKDSVERYEPCVLARYLVELSQAYNRFYFVRRIASEPTPIKTARAMLTKATHIVLQEGLRLLGISAPQKM